MIYGYARVSTVKQQRNGSSLEEQVARLKEAGATEIYQDSYTGTKVNRPAFTEMLGKLNPGDKLIVTKLDRFARTAIEGGQIVQQLHGKGVVIHILNMGVADNSPMGKLMVTMLLAFAEFERDMIMERTQTGRQTKDHLGGRPHKYTTVQIEHAMELLTDHSYSEVERMVGISKSTLVRLRKGKK